MKKVLIALCLVWSFSANAQLNLYSLQSLSGNFDTLVSGNRVTAIEADDEESGGIPLGFNFVFDGDTFQHVQTSSNGVLFFDTTSNYVTPTNDLDFSSTSIRPLLAPLWDDLDGRATGGSKASWDTTGSAPNRVFTFEWLRYELYYQSNVPVISFQVKLYESTNVIEYIYQQESGNPLFGSASIGLASSSTGSGNFLSLDGTGSSPGYSTTTEYSSLSSKPATGQIYRFLPPKDRDIGIQGIVSVPCGGTSDVVVVLKNYGQDTVTSANVGWSVATNGGTPASQTGASWTGSLLSGDTAHVNLGSFLFSSSASYDLIVYSDAPNGLTDEQVVNDTLNQNGFRTGMSGTYTIGGAGPDYPNFSAAVAALDSFGVCGNVNFDVRFAGYNEQVVIGSITGAGPSATITFKAAPGAAAIPEMYYIGSSSDNYIVRFEDASYVTFDSIFLDNTGTLYGHAVEFLGSNSNITIQNCRLRSSTSNTSTNGAIIYDYTGTGNKSNDITIKNNSLENGSYGMYIYGASSTDFQENFEITGNSISNFYYMGISCYYTANGHIDDNYIEDLGTYTSPRGIYAYYSDTLSAQGNEVLLNGTSSPYGIYMYNCDGSTSKPTICANNSVAMYNPSATGSPYGIYGAEGTENRIYFNSIRLESGGTSSRALYLAFSSGDNAIVMNNTASNFGQGYAVYTNPFTGVDSSDYNNFHSLGSNLGYWGGNRTSLTIYAALSGKESNSISVDPNHWSSTDLRTRSVDLNNSGTPRSLVTEDFFGTTRSTTSPDIGLEEYTPPAKDVGVLGIINDLSACGVTNQDVKAIVKNHGTAAQSNIRVVLEVSGAVTSTLVDTLTGSLASGATDTVTFSSINTSVGGILNFRSYTDFSGDTIGANDTIEFGGLTVRALPTAPVVQDFSICFGTDTLVTASSSLDSVEWYSSATSNTPLYVGSTYGITGLAQTDTFYLEGYDMSKESLGAVDSAIGFGNNYTSMTDGLVFNVYNSITLDSVTVYPNGGGNVVVILENSAGSILQSKTIAVSSAGMKRISVDFDIQPGNNYALHANTTTTGGLFRNSGGATYPMANAGSDVEITQTINNLAGYYYFFYDWAITVEGCHSERIPMEVTVDSLPILNLGADTGYCVGTSLGYTLNAYNDSATYLWHDNSTNPSFTFNGAGNYSVEVTTPAGCSISDTIVVSTFAPPTATLIALTDVCESSAPYIFTNGGGTPAGGTGLYLGPGIVSDSVFSPGAAGDGTHTIRYVYASGPGCADTTTSSIVVKPKPTASLSTIPSVCANGAPFTLNQGSGVPAGGTELYFGQGVTGGQFNPIVGIGKYDVGYVYTGTNGCVDTVIQEVSVDSLPTVSLGSVASVCESATPYALTHGNPSGGVYSGTGISNDSIFNPSITGGGTQSISYNFTDDNGCSGSASGVLRVNANPVVNIGPDTVICEGETYFLDAGFGFSGYEWSTGSTANSIAVVSAGVYTITVSDSRGCLGVDSIEVTIEVCTGLEELAKSGIELFPNPSSGTIHLKSLNSSALSNLEILDVSGRIVHKSAGKLSSDLSLELGDLSPGIYTLKVEKEGEALQLKFILE